MDKEALKKKIMERVEIDAVTGCWNWTGKKQKNGVPVFSFNSTNHTVPRLCFNVFIGDIFERSVTVQQHCDNKSCVNPNHLTLLKQGSKIKKIQKPETCKKGHPLSGDNLTVLKSGYWNCKICVNEDRRLRRI